MPNKMYLYVLASARYNRYNCNEDKNMITHHKPQKTVTGLNNFFSVLIPISAKSIHRKTPHTIVTLNLLLHVNYRFPSNIDILSFIPIFLLIYLVLCEQASFSLLITLSL